MRSSYDVWIIHHQICVMITKSNVIVSDHDLMGGTPVFRGTRVPIKNLIDYLEAGDSLDTFLEHFPSVTRQDAISVLELAKEMLIAYANPA
jgi:uncharacterized protein (DUF433 family)